MQCSFAIGAIRGASHIFLHLGFTVQDGYHTGFERGASALLENPKASRHDHKMEKGALSA